MWIILVLKAIFLKLSTFSSTFYLFLNTAFSFFFPKFIFFASELIAMPI